MAAPLPLPPDSVPFLDANGRINIQWQNYMQGLDDALTVDVAPKDAQYWVSTANSELTNERNFGALATGYVKITTALGIAVPSTSATIPASVLTGSLPALNASALTNLNATELSTGTVPDGRFPATLPAVSGVNLTALNASNLGSGTVPAARFPAWATTAFSAGNFTASGTMTWTVAVGDVVTNRTQRLGNTMLVSIRLVTTTVAGTPSTGLRITLPATVTQTSGFPFSYDDNGTSGIGTAVATAGSAVLELFKAASANWSAATDATGIYVSGAVEV